MSELLSSSFVVWLLHVQLIWMSYLVISGNVRFFQFPLGIARWRGVRSSTPSIEASALESSSFSILKTDFGFDRIVQGSSTAYWSFIVVYRIFCLFQEYLRMVSIEWVAIVFLLVTISYDLWESHKKCHSHIVDNWTGCGIQLFRCCTNSTFFFSIALAHSALHNFHFRWIYCRNSVHEAS